MPALIRAADTKVTSKDGEVKVSIALELTINLNADGLNVAAKASTKEVEASVTEVEAAAEQREKDWLIPSFTSNKKLKFGKIETTE